MNRQLEVKLLIVEVEEDTRWIDKIKNGRPLRSLEIQTEVTVEEALVIWSAGVKTYLMSLIILPIRGCMKE